MKTQRRVVTAHSDVKWKGLKVDRAEMIVEDLKIVCRDKMLLFSERRVELELQGIGMALV